MRNLILMIAFVLGTTACHSITVKNGPDVSTAPTNEQWHHIGILRLVEFSSPVDLSQACPKGWNAVETRENAVQVLIGLIPYVSTFYSPMEVRLACK